MAQANPNAPLPVPAPKITSVDITAPFSGLYLNGDQNAPNNALTASKDIELTIDGLVAPRRKLTPFLPDTVETTYQKFPALWDNELYYFTLDNGKARFCQEGDTNWTDCGPVGTAASFTTNLNPTMNNDLVFTARETGSRGNNITIEYDAPTTPNHVLVVSVMDTHIVVTLATDGSSLVSTVANDVMAAIAADTSANSLVAVTLASGNTGGGHVKAMPVESLTGGGGENDFTTDNGGMPILLRVLNSILIINGGNGDKLAYIDLTSDGFPVVRYELVTDPTIAPTGVATGLTGTDFNIYYATSFSGKIGETNLSPIQTVPVGTSRDQWDGSTESIQLTLGDTPPDDAQFWNVYIALSATAGTIQPTDMLLLAAKLDLSTVTFTDNSTLPIQLGQPAPTDNSTDGPIVTNGLVEDGNPILWGDNYNIWIGGGGQNALSFSTSNGGYLAQPELGTNYFPSAIIGFRTGQGVPALTVLYSNTEGLSKQAVLQQQVVNYGDQSFTVWGVTEQHYGAAGVAAPNSAINYNGKLLFLSTDSFMSAETEPTVQNVLSILPIASSIDPYVRSIKNAAMKTVVGAGWDNKYMWLVPANNFDTPQQILVLDTNQKGTNGDGAWYTLNIPAQWIGVISPQNAAAFVYVCQGNKTYKLLSSVSTYDTKNGVNIPFSTRATGALIGLGGTAHNEWQATVQAMFYILDIVGSVTVTVTYRNEDGNLKTKTKTFNGPVFTPSVVGGWGDTGWSYIGGPTWAGEPSIGDTDGVVTTMDKRIPLTIDDIASEAEWSVSSATGFNYWRLKAISYEGISLGVLPDLQ